MKQGRLKVIYVILQYHVKNSRGIDRFYDDDDDGDNYYRKDQCYTSVC